ncbi:MAG TPA: DinB family protein [Gemmatimonadales bacterium]|nr:DinB family protein [Gemmatimonadales bacterium]
MRFALGTTLLAVCTLPLTLVGTSQAQNPVMNGVRAIAKRQTKNIVEAAEEMPADKYSYKPTAAQMTFGDVVAHLIKEGNNYLCSATTGTKAPDADKFSGTDAKDKLVAGLKDSFKYCETVLAQIQDAQLGDSIDFFGGRKVTKGMAALITVADWADHYSQMAIYLRLNGHLPPTAKKAD